MDLIYDWNAVEDGVLYPHNLQLHDETLRDGLQSPSVCNPNINDKIKLVHLMDQLGIQSVDLGLPAAGLHACADIIALCRAIVDLRLKIRPAAAVRTAKADITPLVKISQKVGISIEVLAFIGSSPIRQYAEGWSLDTMLRLTDEAVSFAVQNGLPVTYVTEDTTRSTPDTIKRLFTTAVEAGAWRICVCDTVGHSTPEGTHNFVGFVKSLVQSLGADVGIDWHGHNDRGLALANTLAAMKAGATRVHATALGIGERVGNCSMDQLLINLKLMGYIDTDLELLVEYCRLASEATEVPIPINYPVFGRDAFRTATGVHAAAIIKAKKKGDNWLADRVYSGVPAGMVGLTQSIEVGFMSGVSNVVQWLHAHGIEPTDHLIEMILTAAKVHNHVLTDEEILQILRR